MIKIGYTSGFVKIFKKLNLDLASEALEKINLFRNPDNHSQLKVHKLKGRLSGRYSFSVNYRTRIIFIYISKDTANLLSIGDHDIYK